MTGSKNISKVFVVGMARSGTTLVQSILHSHSKIISFPETHFLSKSIFIPRYLRFAPISMSSVRNVNKMLRKIGIDDKLKIYPRFSKSNFVAEVCEIFDKYAASQNKTIWVEKTPLHLLFIELIEASCSSAKFVHVIRNPRDNINSLLKASIEHQDFFAQDTLDKAIDRYLRDSKESLKYVKKKNHYFINYNNLIKDPEKQIKSLCGFIGIAYESEMLNVNQSVDQLIMDEEEWKKNNKKAIAKTDSKLIVSEKDFDVIKNRAEPVWSQWKNHFGI